jgi:hypothetical protein
MATEAKILSYLDGLMNWVLDSEVIVMLISMPRLERSLLAARQYIRFMATGKKVWEHWSWSAEQEAAWYKSAEYKQASNLIDDINRTFQASNTGYKLRINKTLRNEQEQLNAWLSSKDILRLGGELKNKIAKELDGAGYADTPGQAEAEKFRAYLAKVSLSEKIMLAPPGLSDHGHGGAYDFVVLEKTTDKMMASTGKSWVSTWDGPHGWTGKLKTAIEASGQGHFKGPLATPYEPWHYEYS